jgi:hypothetical protein
MGLWINGRRTQERRQQATRSLLRTKQVDGLGILESGQLLDAGNSTGGCMNLTLEQQTTEVPALERQYLVTSFQKLNHSDGIMGLLLRVTVAQPIEWVRKHAEDIAKRGIQQDAVAKTLTSPIIALNVEIADEVNQEGERNAN